MFLVYMGWENWKWRTVYSLVLTFHFFYLMQSSVNFWFGSCHWIWRVCRFCCCYCAVVVVVVVLPW